MLHTAAERLSLISINLNFLEVKDDCQSGRLKISHNIVGGKKKKKKNVKDIIYTLHNVFKTISAVSNSDKSNPYVRREEEE